MKQPQSTPDSLLPDEEQGRRRARGSGMMPTENAREASIVQAFDRSRLPQAIVSVDGLVVTCYRAFNKLVSMDEKGVEGLPVTDLSIATYVPGLLRALRTVHTEGKPSERRAKVYRGSKKAPLALVIWLTPLPIPGQEIHMLIRVEEVDPRRSTPGDEG